MSDLFDGHDDLDHFADVYFEIELSSGAVSVGQQLEGAQVGAPAGLASRVRVGRVIQREHSSPHIQNIAPHQKIHYYCLGFCSDLPIIYIVNHHNNASGTILNATRILCVYLNFYSKLHSMLISKWTNVFDH